MLGLAPLYIFFKDYEMWIVSFKRKSAFCCFVQHNNQILIKLSWAKLSKPSFESSVWSHSCMAFGILTCCACTESVKMLKMFTSFTLNWGLKAFLKFYITLDVQDFTTPASFTAQSKVLWCDQHLWLMLIHMEWAKKRKWIWRMDFPSYGWNGLEFHLCAWLSATTQLGFICFQVWMANYLWGGISVKQQSPEAGFSQFSLRILVSSLWCFCYPWYPCFEKSILESPFLTMGIQMSGKTHSTHDPHATQHQPKRIYFLSLTQPYCPSLFTF